MDPSSSGARIKRDEPTGQQIDAITDVDPAGAAPPPPRPPGAATSRKGGPAPAQALLTDAERDALYADLQPLVRRLIRQYGEDREFREDLEGEIYSRFCQLVAAYDPSLHVPLTAYVVRTLPPSIYRYARACWRDARRASSLEDDPLRLAAMLVPDRTEEWLEQIETGRLLQSLLAGISRLPPRQREVVILRYYEGYSFEEIAQRLEVRPATARSLLRYGRNHLRRAIELAEPAQATTPSRRGSSGD